MKENYFKQSIAHTVWLLAKAPMLSLMPQSLSLAVGFSCDSWLCVRPGNTSCSEAALCPAEMRWWHTHYQYAMSLAASVWSLGHFCPWLFCLKHSVIGAPITVSLSVRAKTKRLQWVQLIGRFDSWILFCDLSTISWMSFLIKECMNCDKFG